MTTKKENKSEAEIITVTEITVTDKNLDVVNDYLKGKIPQEEHIWTAPDGKTTAKTNCSCGVYWHQKEDGTWFSQEKCFCEWRD